MQERRTGQQDLSAGDGGPRFMVPRRSPPFGRVLSGAGDGSIAPHQVQRILKRERRAVAIALAEPAAALDEIAFLGFGSGDPWSPWDP